jgi:hypothetical protein
MGVAQNNKFQPGIGRHQEKKSWHEIKEEWLDKKEETEEEKKEEEEEEKSRQGQSMCYRFLWWNCNLMHKSGSSEVIHENCK